MRSSCERTATFARSPGSRAIRLISIMPSYTSGISISKSRMRKAGSVLEMITVGFPAPLRTSFTMARIVSPFL